MQAVIRMIMNNRKNLMNKIFPTHGYDMENLPSIQCLLCEVKPL